MNIYNMELHDEISLTSNLWVIRVPRGWIYSLMDDNENTVNTFVPYDNEFQGAKDTIKLLKGEL